MKRSDVGACPRSGSVRTSASRPNSRLGIATALLALLAVLASCSGGSDPAADATDDQVGSTDDASQWAGWEPEDCTVDAAAEAPVTVAVPDVESDLDVTSFDGTTIRTHWFPLPDATEPAPTVLMGPGWGLAGDTVIDEVGPLGSISIGLLHDAGYNVMTWDPRGFGESGGTATVNSPDAEGRDVQVLIDWLSAQPEVRLDAPGDPALGMLGGSYGGGIQLVSAAIDCRVDAIVPNVAWNSLEASLYPEGIIKIGWAETLGQVTATASVDPHIDSALESGQATGIISDEDLEWFVERGPADLVADIAIPTLLVHGTVDTLFTPSEALTNFELLSTTGAPLTMLWYCGGHGACLTDPGDEERVARASIDWLDRWVAGDTEVEFGPRIDLIDQNGEIHGFEEFPEATSHVSGTGSGRLELTAQGGAGPIDPEDTTGELVDSLSVDLTPARAANSVDVTVELDDDALIIGAPELTLTYRGETSAGGRPTIVFAQLVDETSGLVVGNQITPVAVVLDGEEHTTTVPLEVVSHSAARRDRITLQIVATTVAYAHPALGGTLDITDVSVDLPVVET